MNDGEFIGKAAELAAKWSAAKEWMQAGENVDKKDLVTAIDEMRRAGECIVNAFAAHQNGDAQQAEKLLAAAALCLKEARHNVVDAVFAVQTDKATEALEKIGAPAAQKHFPKYAELFSLTKAMGQKTENAKKDQMRQDAIYAELLSDLPLLESLCAEFEVSIDPIGESLRQERARHRTALIVAIVIAVVGWVVALL